MTDPNAALDALFEPFGGIEKFRHEYWPGGFATAAGNPGRLVALTDRFLVPREQAMDWYEQGAALELDFAHLFLPGMSRLVSRARNFFGLPGGTIAKGIVYAAKRGGGSPAHFDAYVNFVFQSAGEGAVPQGTVPGT